jgi:formylglycine-generating enzyme
MTSRIIAFAVAVIVAAGLARADVFHMPSGQTSLDFVTIGDPGNAADTRWAHFGAVGYTYQMGKFDVTAAQYCQFLNAVAATDAYGLYNSYMANVGGPYNFPQTNCGCGITRSGVPGSYTYSVLPDAGTPGQPGYANYANFPVNYVSWGDAARFSNWLQNGQPTGAQGSATTETGSYTLNGAVDDLSLAAVTRNAGARYVIPSENEWYKAAYYKGSGTDAGYWQYTTRSDAVPSNVFSAAGTNSANFFAGGYTDSANFLTPVGYFAASPGPYDTYDMGGDVDLWTESPLSNNARMKRGGSFQHDVGALGSWARGNSYPSADFCVCGFRVAEIPEPGSMAMLLAGAIGLFCYWARRRTPAACGVES